MMIMMTIGTVTLTLMIGMLMDDEEVGTAYINQREHNIHTTQWNT